VLRAGADWAGLPVGPVGPASMWGRYVKC